MDTSATAATSSPVPGALTIVMRHPFVSLALGAAIVLSLIAVPTGLGAIVAPWFVCELFAVQLASLGEAPQPRGRGWVSAAIVVSGIVVVIAIAGWIAALGFGPDVTTADRVSPPLPWPEALRRMGLVAGTGALAVIAGTPLLYAPLVLLDRGGRLGGAFLESAALVWSGGALRHYALAFLANLLSLSPALVSMVVVARTIERAATPLGALFALPLLTASIPLGLALVTRSYLARRDALPDTRLLRRDEPLPPGLVALLTFVTMAPLVGLVMMAGAGLVPAIPAVGALPEHAIVLVDTDARAAIEVPDTTLEVRIDGAHADVLAGDGDGVGRLPDTSDARITHVRVGRLGDDYAVELAQGGETRMVRVDRAGLRVDDSVEARLRSRSPDVMLIAFVIAFAFCGIGSLACLAPLGEARARRRPALRARRLATRIALALVPFSLLALTSGAIALFGVP